MHRKSERPLEYFFFASPETESLFKYKPGGHHPVHLGDAFSTVWLAEDLAYDGRAVALKITVADTDANSRREADVLKHLFPAGSDISEHPGKQHVLRLLDHFEIQGPNGTHQVLVTDVLLPFDFLQDMSLKDTTFECKRACYESLLGLSYLAHQGVVHGGAFLILVPTSLTID
ncbi:hypothetical protein H0H81_002079 [Sphagnurus paluster]|uniref:non-specific serine/threonine protein kinase n=1 Tax=Sphagnurus paluster TaxID=117069 RepID=A0A9P7K1K7_9AGAR|nr:hypothetical protein H0H81_002079 [Sphagnurus paluster]